MVNTISISKLEMELLQRIIKEKCHSLESGSGEHSSLCSLDVKLSGLFGLEYDITAITYGRKFPQT